MGWMRGWLRIGILLMPISVLRWNGEAERRASTAVALGEPAYDVVFVLMLGKNNSTAKREDSDFFRCGRGCAAFGNEARWFRLHRQHRHPGFDFSVAY